MTRETRMSTFLQARTPDYLKKNPQETWRCMILARGGSEHNGIGETEAEAIHNASLHYLHYSNGRI